MAKGFKSGGRGFKKGQSGNPNGSPSKNITKARKLNKVLVTELLNKFINMSMKDLIVFIRNNVPNSKDTTAFKGDDPVIETMLASILVKAIQEGDQNRLNFIFDRLIGKVTDKVEYTLPVPTLVRRFESQETLELGASAGIIDTDGEDVSE